MKEFQSKQKINYCSLMIYNIVSWNSLSTRETEMLDAKYKRQERGKVETRREMIKTINYAD